MPFSSATRSASELKLRLSSPPTAIETVPSNIIAGLFHFTQAQYFEADEQSRQVPQVSFSK